MKINGGYYRDMLLSQQLLLVMCDVSGDFFIFQQHSAPAHRALDTVRFLEQSTPAFIPPDLWPPNNTDLNPVDYKICGDIQQRMHQSQLHSIDELKKRLLEVWHGMDQSVIDDAIDGWRMRLRVRIRAKGGGVVNLTIALFTEPYNKICLVSSNMTFVICCKFEL